jgi:hypothetical protein
MTTSTCGAGAKSVRRKRCTIAGSNHGLSKRRDKRSARLADEALGGLALHHQVTVLRRTGRVCQSIDDGGSCVERDVGEDLIRPMRQGHFADIAAVDADQRLVGKLHGEPVCQG